jgi:molybdopterin-guanine dinucleotide biosynthesis protein A
VAIVLAGGKSSRMGRDKASIIVQGQSMLAQVCLAAQQVTERIYIVLREGQGDVFTDLRQSWRLVIDSQLDGAMVGFWQGIAAIAEPCDWILLLACDLPKLHGKILQTWAGQLEQHQGNIIAYLPKTEAQWEPLCGFYAWHCQDSLRQFIEAGGRSFQDWLEGQPVREIDHDASDMLFNCNTPKDLGVISTAESMGNS